jgi:Zn-dependent protease
MGGKRYKIATVWGVPIYVGTSWIFIVILFVWSQYVGLTQSESILKPGEAMVLSVVATALFFGSVLAHETAHAIMARTLDLPVTGITLVFWGGATETRSSGRGPLGEFLVAFVGPATTLVLSVFFWGLSRATHGVASDVMHYLAFISLLFAGLNALPGFPLDGGRMLLATMWGITKNRAKALRITGYVGIVVGGLFIAYAVMNFSRLEAFAIFLGYIGFIMIATGRGMDARVKFLGEMARGRVSDAMRPPPPAVPADMSLSQAMDYYLGRAGGQAFPVVQGGRVIGMLSTASSRQVGRRNPMRPVRDGMAPIGQTPVFDPNDRLDEAVEWLAGREGLVLNDGALVGAIGPRDIEAWYRRTIDGGFGAPGGAAAPGATGFGAQVGPVPPRPDVLPP